MVQEIHIKDTLLKQWLKNEWWANGKVLRTKFDVHTCVKANKISWIINKR